MGLKQTGRRIFNAMGYRVERIKPEDRPGGYRWRDFGDGWDTSRLEVLPIKVNSIVDVGVAAGTPSLYRAFPQCPLVLIEPLTLFNSKIIDLLGPRARDAEIVNCGVGRQEEDGVFYYNNKMPMTGSLHKRKELSPEDMIEVKVKIRPIDDILSQHRLPRPHLLKIDVEGNELAAVQGATKTLEDTGLLIIEVTLDGSYPSGQGVLGAIDAILKKAGFVLVDLADATVTGSLARRSVKKADLIYINPRYSLRSL
jgi:FkbM family methyltransferase